MPLFREFTNYCESNFSPTTRCNALSGLNEDLWATIFNYFKLQEGFFQNKKSTVFVFQSDDLAYNFYQQLKSNFDPSLQLYHYTMPENGPYSGHIGSDRFVTELFEVLSKIVYSKTHLCLVTSITTLSKKIPTIEFFKENFFAINTEDIISPDDLANKLVTLGYSPVISVEEPGTFCKKGEVFDIFPVGHRPIRINYYDDLIEKISFIDPMSGKTLEQSSTKVIIPPAPNILSSEIYRNNLRNKIPIPGPKYPKKFEHRKSIFNSLSNGNLFEGHGDYLPLFFSQTCSLIDYFDNSENLFIFVDHQQCFDSFSSLRDSYLNDYQNILEDENSSIIIPHPDELILSQTTLQERFQICSLADLNYTIKPLTDYYIINQLDSSKNNLVDLLKQSISENRQILFSYSSEAALNEIKYLIDYDNLHLDQKSNFHILKNLQSRGFFLEKENLLCVCDSDFFSKKIAKTKSKAKVISDVFSEQLATLTNGDFVIHATHGIGIYRGLVSMENSGISSDFIIIEYDDNDKIYLPVYKLNLIQKHADSAANLKVTNLRTNAFTQAKERARQSAKELAFDLLELQAKRQSTQSFAFSPPDHLYNEFELAFPFVQTEDQAKASESVIEAMTKETPMDFLVCGDVGFGKTEIAMRAAFKAVLDKKQVAVLVPTTILALQHYNSFSSRFSSFGVSIEFLSRFKTPQQVKEIKQKLSDGKIDIIIGTHKLLAKDIIFSDLGLVIVDEEQRFGVGHKEQLKVLKSSVDFLTLTATPIPRTLQLALFGLRELSIIQTPPPKRQSISTFVIKDDDWAIKEAIEKELKRGGQVYFVHNRVEDIEMQRHRLLELVPNATITIGHGQLPERELENRIRDFYMGKFQILLCTTIIESGIDIPNANTMIVNRADTFGLSQLHQLRGRIGRSDRKAYAFFVIPNNKLLSTIAESRLKALKSYAELGSGFSIASCDLEIRGAGDILGATQSGHIESVGLELYMELLQEAINELKGKPSKKVENIEISTSFPGHIPESYVSDSGTRLKFYKKLSKATSELEIDELYDSLADQYGKPPKEVSNLSTILKVKVVFQNIGVRAINVLGPSIIFSFDKEFMTQNPDTRNRLVDYVLKHKKRYQVTPDFKLIYSHTAPIDQNTLLEISKNIALQIVPC